MTVNYWAIIVAALAQWLLGWAWYSVLFGKLWMKLSGITMNPNDPDAKKKGMQAMLSGLIGSLIMSAVLSYVISIEPNLQRRVVREKNI